MSKAECRSCSLAPSCAQRVSGLCDAIKIRQQWLYRGLSLPGVWVRLATWVLSMMPNDRRAIIVRRFELARTPYNYWAWINAGAVRWNPTAYEIGVNSVILWNQSTLPHTVFKAEDYALNSVSVQLARTIYIRCIYDIFGRKITKYTVIYSVCIRFWPILCKWDKLLKPLASALMCRKRGLFHTMKTKADRCVRQLRQGIKLCMTQKAGLNAI